MQFTGSHLPADAGRAGGERRRRNLRGRALLIAVLAAAASALAPTPGLAASGGGETGADPRIANTARLVREHTALRSAPGGRIVRRLGAYTEGGERARLLVLGERTRGGVRWLELLLPTRPNGSTGWIRADGASLSAEPYEIRISTGTRKLQLLRGDRVLLQTGVVIGTAATPTPRGQFAIYDRYRTSTVLAPWILELTAHSNVLHEFAGGPGRVAIHGMQGSLRVPVGTARSHGCIRVPTAPLKAIARAVRLGTPVRIVAAPLSKLAR